MPIITTQSVDVIARESEVFTRRDFSLADGTVIPSGTRCEVIRTRLSVDAGGNIKVQHRLETIPENDTDVEIVFATKFMKPERVSRYLDLIEQDGPTALRDDE